MSDGTGQARLHLLHVVEHAFLIVGRGLHVRGEVALGDARRDLRGQRGLTPQLLLQADGHPHHHHAHQRAHAQQPGQRFPQRLAEFSVDVIEVEPGDEVPVPRLEVQHVAQLGLGRLGARLGPQVFDEAVARVLAQRGNLPEQVDPVGVLHVAHVLAIQLLLDGMHEHHVIRTHHGEIAVRAKAQCAHAVQRLLLGLFHRQLAGPRHRLVLGDDGVGDIGHLLERQLAIVQAQRAHFPGIPEGDGQQADPAQHQGQHELLSQAEILQHSISSFSMSETRSGRSLCRPLWVP
ncbi:hypothetical protein D3C87_1274620 [compost metagenome]